MLRACVFDLDGTLVDTLPTIHHYCCASLTHFGLEPVTLAQCQRLCRLPGVEFYPQLLRFGGCPEERVEELREPICQYDHASYLQNVFYLTEPYPGVKSMLGQLREMGVITAVLTNKPALLAAPLMERFFPGLLDEIAGQTAQTIPKPDPRSLTGLLDRLGVDRKSCLYVGDSDVDMITARDAGVSACAVTWGYQTREELSLFSPAWFAGSAEELPDICRRLSADN